MNLTPRERAVLTGIGSGLPDKAIARDLGLSVSTVKAHAKMIRAKLGNGYSNRVQLALYAAGRIT
jgi:DNA-binding NarL/FixJ family response regulator